MEMIRKGFYFSFDALLALTVMTATLAVVSQSSFVASNSFEVTNIDYRAATTSGQDAMKLASYQDFSRFNGSFRQELVDETAMTDSDLDRTIIDGVSLLWASRNISHAEEVARKYFDSKISDKYEYRLQVNENGSNTIIYQSSEMPESPEIVSSISRLVSGHKIDRPSEGFQARARATSVTKNETKIIPVPPLGMAPQNSEMEVEKEFWLNNTDQIHNGTFYLSVHYSGASHFQQFRINGNQYGEAKFDWVHEDDSGAGAASYGYLDIKDDLKEGKNTLYLRLRGGNSYNSHFHPGTKVEIDYSTGENYTLRDELVHEKIDIENIVSEGGGNSEAGIFSVKQFTVPEGTEFVNATYNLQAESLDSECGYEFWWWRQPGWDVEINLNEQTISAECASGTYQKQIELAESDIREGTNVITTFIESQGDTRWGGDQTVLNSDSSYIDLWYRRSEDQLRFGEIKVSASENIGGEVRQPKQYQKEFEYDSLESTNLYIAQLFSTNPEINVDDGINYRNVFSSESPRSAPTSIYIGRDYYSLDRSNRIIMEDTDFNPERSYLPESTFEWTVWAPSQVGYGRLFDNESAALEDAKQRLETEMGEFIEATGIETGSLSTGDQPYLWGPASVKLVIWRE